MRGIEIKEVSKGYKDTKALDHVSVQFEDGKIYALLGRNGAGKSTMLNIISNRIFPDQGEVLVDGKPARENDQVQQNMYLMSEQTLYPADEDPAGISMVEGILSEVRYGVCDGTCRDVWAEYEEKSADTFHRV